MWPHKGFLVGGLAAGLVFAPVSVARAQPDDDAEAEVDDDASDSDSDGADSNGAALDSDDSDSADSDGDGPPEGTWGVGVVEEEGKYKPRGKTGKLKDAEEEEEEEEVEKVLGPRVLPPPGFAYLDTAFAFGKLVVVTQPTGGTSIEPTASFLIGLGYRMGDTWQVSVRFPISTGENDGPIDSRIQGGRNPDKFTQIATGALELGVRPHFELSRAFTLPVGLALTLPTAAGDQFPSPENKAQRGQAIVNAAASASRGWEDRALFAHKRFGLIPNGGILWDSDFGPGTLHLGARTKIELMFDTAGNEPPDAADLNQDGKPDPSEVAELAGTHVSWLLGSSAHYDMFDGLLGASLRAWFTVSNAPEIKGSIDPGGSQFVLEPGLRSHLPFSDGESVGLDANLAYMLPVGGELGGGNPASVSVGGLRIRVGLFF